jgi:hypothetical protein
MIKVNIKSQTRQIFKGGGSTFYGEPFKSVPPRFLAWAMQLVLFTEYAC